MSIIAGSVRFRVPFLASKEMRCEEFDIFIDSTVLSLPLEVARSMLPDRN
jgi:hypothetical protein